MHRSDGAADKAVALERAIRQGQVWVAGVTVLASRVAVATLAGVDVGLADPA